MMRFLTSFGMTIQNEVLAPDSGTGELAGWSGRMNITITPGRHDYEFEYQLG